MVEFTEEEPDVDILEDKIVKAIAESKKIEYSAENYIPVPQTADQMIKEKKENEIQYLETAVEFYSKDFKTIENIDLKQQQSLMRVWE